MFMTNTDDKRETIRLTLDSEVSIFDEQHNLITGKLQNLSAKGVSVVTDDILPEGCDCRVSITIQGNNSTLNINELNAKVIHSSKRMLGLEFEDKMEWLTLFYVYRNKFHMDKA